ncbi:hypothetical protein GCM10027262_31810 [Nocardia tengchongensis]
MLRLHVRRGLLTFPRVGYHLCPLTIGYRTAGWAVLPASVCRCRTGSLASESHPGRAGFECFARYDCENTSGPAGKRIDEKR